MVAAQQQDVLEKSVAFLQKRDGIDKVLKVVRYAAKLACVSVLKDSDSDLAVQLRGFESSVGVTRCAALHVKKFGISSTMHTVARIQESEFTSMRVGVISRG